MHVSSTIPSTVHYLTVKYQATFPSTLFFQLHCKHHPITEMTESQHTCCSRSDPPHHCVASNNRQRQVNFQRVLLFPSPFSPMSLATSHFFLIEQLWSYHGNMPKLSPQTELSLPPHTTTLPTTTGRGEYIFVVSFHVL
jgi:hypothetical protein